MRYSNLHNHSTFSDGKCSPEENIQAAIARNMISIGFSDHSYTEFDPDTYCMKKGRLTEYIAEIGRLKERYRDQMEVYLGMELDGFSVLEDKTPFDYIIGCCHYVKTCAGNISVEHNIEWQKTTAEKYFDGDLIKFFQTYYDGYVESVRREKPDILGHFDLISKYGLPDENDPRYRKMATESLLACLEVTPIIEVNTGGIARGYMNAPFPASFLLDEIKAHGGRMILGADSHHVNNLTFFS